MSEHLSAVVLILASIAAIGLVFSIRQLRKRKWDYCLEAPAIIEWTDICEDEPPTKDKSRPYIAAIKYTYYVNGYAAGPSLQ